MYSHMKIHMLFEKQLFNVSSNIMYGWACINLVEKLFLADFIFLLYFLIKRFRTLYIIYFSYFHRTLKLLLKFVQKIRGHLV